jgi:hypothetical protein
MVGTELPNGVLLDRSVATSCCHCRRVRTVAGWEYAEVPADTRVSHGICRECFVAYYPEFAPPPDAD